MLSGSADFLTPFLEQENDSKGSWARRTAQADVGVILRENVRTRTGRLCQQCWDKGLNAQRAIIWGSLWGGDSRKLSKGSFKVHKNLYLLAEKMNTAWTVLHDFPQRISDYGSPLLVFHFPFFPFHNLYVLLLSFCFFSFCAKFYVFYFEFSLFVAFSLLAMCHSNLFVRLVFESWDCGSARKDTEAQGYKAFNRVKWDTLSTYNRSSLWGVTGIGGDWKWKTGGAETSPVYFHSFI